MFRLVFILFSWRRRCHQKEGGGGHEACKNTETPDKLPNEYKFHTNVVNEAARLMHAWFNDKDLGMCRVVELGGFKKPDGEIEPVLYYDYFDENGEVETDKSTLIEVAEWVEKEKTNINL